MGNHRAGKLEVLERSSSAMDEGREGLEKFGQRRAVVPALRSLRGAGDGVESLPGLHSGEQLTLSRCRCQYPIAQADAGRRAQA